MTQIHYFPRYSQKENFSTNNTLLLFHRLYSFSRFKFERFVTALLRDVGADANSTLDLGLQIKQQIGTGKSIVDGYLYQNSVKIAIETKLSAKSFDVDQLSRHVSGFYQAGGGLLILLSPERTQLERSNSEWQQLKSFAEERNVVLVSASFEDLVTAARGCLNDYNEEMHALVADYESFCSGEGLLPTDKWTLFVPPCGQSHEINVAYELYFCPASWTRRKAQYIGIYNDKAVRHIGTLSKVIECDIDKGQIINGTEPLTDNERERIVRATAAVKHEKGWDISMDHQFFLCDEMVETRFEKSTPRGIMGHRYFDLRMFFPDGMPPRLHDIAEQLRSHRWE